MQHFYAKVSRCSVAEAFSFKVHLCNWIEKNISLFKRKQSSPNIPIYTIYLSTVKFLSIFLCVCGTPIHRVDVMFARLICGCTSKITCLQRTLTYQIIKCESAQSFFFNCPVNILSTGAQAIPSLSQLIVLCRKTLFFPKWVKKKNKFLILGILDSEGNNLQQYIESLTETWLFPS